MTPDVPIEVEDVCARFSVLSPSGRYPTRPSRPIAGSGSGNGTIEDVTEVAASEIALCFTKPSRLVPVDVNGRRTSHSDRPSSFHTSASRTARSLPCRCAFADVVDHATTLSAERRSSTFRRFAREPRTTSLELAPMAEPQSVAIVGAGPGLGFAIARRSHEPTGRSASWRCARR